MTRYRHTLTFGESGQWHHVNPGVANWRQNQIIELGSVTEVSKGLSA